MIRSHPLHACCCWPIDSYLITGNKPGMYTNISHSIGHVNSYRYMHFNMDLHAYMYMYTYTYMFSHTHLVATVNLSPHKIHTLIYQVCP